MAGKRIRPAADAAPHPDSGHPLPPSPSSRSPSSPSAASTYPADRALTASAAKPRLQGVVGRAVDQACRLEQLAQRENRFVFGRQTVERRIAGLELRPPKHWRRLAFPLLWSVIAHGLLLIVLQLSGVWEPAETPRLLTVYADVQPPALEQLAPTASLSPSEQPLDSFDEPLPELFDPAEGPALPNDLAGGLASATSAEEALNATKLSTPTSLVRPGAAALLQAIESKTAGRATFFGAPSQGRAICFLIDSSRSMRGKFDLARREVVRAVDSLAPNQRFYVLLFDQNVERMRLGEQTPRQPVPATPVNKRAMFQWLASARMESSCDPVAALDAALGLDSDVLYLLTDGELPQSLLPMLRERNYVEVEGRRRRRMAVHTIGLHSLRGRELLAQLAAENGGVYRFIAKPPR